MNITQMDLHTFLISALVLEKVLPEEIMPVVMGVTGVGVLVGMFAIKYFNKS